jgi:hypothetical protein
LSYLNLSQWPDPNPLAVYDIWMKRTGALEAWWNFVLPPWNVKGCPAPILERSTFITQASTPLPLSAPLALPGDELQYQFTMPVGGGVVKQVVIGTLHVNIWCGRMTFDRFFNQRTVETSHVAAMAKLRQLRDWCMTAGQTVDVTTDQATHVETYYIHKYAEYILPESLPDRDWVVDLVMIDPDGSGIGLH